MKNQNVIITLICFLLLFVVCVVVYLACKKSDEAVPNISVVSGGKKSLLELLAEQKSSEKGSEPEFAYGTRSAEDEAVVKSVLDKLLVV